MTLPFRPIRSVANRDEVVISDRDGNEYGEMIGVAQGDVRPDWDIDRAGSKGRVEISALQGVLKPNMWIKVYRTRIPEVGDIVRYNRGHFKLGRPGESYTGAFAVGDGSAYEMQSASGSDVVDEIAGVLLQETFTTPPGTVVMEEVRALIKLATAGVVGLNLVTNPGFDTSLSGWQVPVSPGGVARHSANRGGVAEMFFDIGAPEGTLQQVYQDFDIPAGTRYIIVSGLSRTAFTQNIRSRLYVDFKSEDGVINARTASPRLRTNNWARTFEVLNVPEGTTSVRVHAQATIHNSSGVSSNLYWDDIRVSTATTPPIPERRINLPTSNAASAGRIQTMVGDNILYDAINSHRLAAIGHQALYTDMGGRLTTSAMRVLATATPKRVYGPGDLRIVGPVEIPPVDTKTIYNRFPAIKESFEEGVEPLYVTSVNDNPHDEYSTVNTKQVRDAPPIIVQDAVSVEALKAVADNARDRYSTQEEIMFNILDDPGMTVNDVIEITDPAMPKASGRWSVQFIACAGAEMTVHARRAIGGG